MTDWFQHSPEESGGGPDAAPENGNAGTSSPPDSENGGWVSPAPDSQTGASVPTGGDTADTPPSSWSEAPSAPPASSGGWQTGPSYNPYGWQPPSYSPAPAPGGPSKPPKKKKSGTGVLIGVLGGLCALTIITLSVLLVLAWDDGIRLPGTTSGGGATSPVSRNPDAPKVQIQELDEDTQGKSTREIVEMNLDSTVIVKMYSSQSGYSIGEQQVGEASGIVLSADGYIITNWHVVVNEDTGEPYSRVSVTLYDGTVFDEVETIGYDQSTDLAVIKVAATNLTPAEFGDSSQLQIGDKVVALGNAGGLSWTATQGIVSGLARDVYEDTGYAIKCLQVDAAINPGNSGGPLMNAAGQVVAVNSAKIVLDGYEGLGFSIPITEAQVIVNDLIEYGYVTGRVTLGIRGVTINQAEYKGFLIDSINEGSPLEGTGAQRGDLITHIDGVRVNNYGELRSELSKHSAGDTVTLTLLRVEYRRENSFTVQATLVEDRGQWLQG